MHRPTIITTLLFFIFSITLSTFFVWDVAHPFLLAIGKEEESEYNISVTSGNVLGAFIKDEEKKGLGYSSVSVEKLVAWEKITPSLKKNYSETAFPTAHASVILDVDSGTILHYSAGKERREIASLTKMMTALLVMENIKNLDDVVTITQEMRSVEGTVIGCPRSGYCIDTRLQVGEKITVRNLMKAMLMNSANDAATSLGIHIDGSVDAFALRMNARAKELGLWDSNFCTPSGLEIDGKDCYSSAYDIARIVAKVFSYEEIRKFMNLPSGLVISSLDGKYSHQLLNTNALLGEYSGLLGTKTGFTPKAGYSLMAVAEDATGKHKIVAVVLDDPYRWDTIKDMFSWAFISYEWK
ncbi:MAG: D-alanyl-D-alanine carboxypeptidase [Candidatus Moraniibacteriota bacterium]|nr:MAG: D-alanyl-D-alanine carboxypeptidase [Candidatus Moranbacteria bacterium]